MDTHLFLGTCHDHLITVVPIGAEIYTVWVCKTLGNNKAIFADSVSNCMYEYTHNGASNEIYFDQYIKFANATIELRPIHKEGKNEN